ncbi:MAG TPA: hypothetical protein DEA43_04100 [Candidatus Moranbacteria bacterium]|nr:hypothetical protein [Candidatus Moranbacteria bacterium]HBT46035.1 hypothetical protein [Candidatus Moranbacteria bacterium]
MAMQIEENRCKVKMTVLYRKGGTWQSCEVSRLADGLITEVSQHPKYPEYLIVFGHYTKEQTLVAHGGGLVYTATQITGIENKELPFIPGFVQNQTIMED